MVGGRDRDRTGDPLLAKQVLSQLSYTPTVVASHSKILSVSIHLISTRWAAMLRQPVDVKFCAKLARGQIGCGRGKTLLNFGFCAGFDEG
jgi:hypothetical protein